MRECGLKLFDDILTQGHSYVTPYAGVWIETLAGYKIITYLCCHSLCGSVD